MVKPPPLTKSDSVDEIVLLKDPLKVREEPKKEVKKVSRSCECIIMDLPTVVVPKKVPRFIKRAGAVKASKAKSGSAALVKMRGVNVDKNGKAEDLVATRADKIEEIRSLLRNSYLSIINQPGPST
ncbi:unnamed protein product [Caenorhabditis sp. 36 PRJEB53466]|nr:unnamed protein product [Caenorhabditis sp. 36 PRJEB53466]